MNPAPYIGISIQKGMSPPWRVKVHYHYRHINLGRYHDPEVAGRVYDYAATLLWGPNAKLNYDGKLPPHISPLAIRAKLALYGVELPPEIEESGLAESPGPA